MKKIRRALYLLVAQRFWNMSIFWAICFLVGAACTTDCVVDDAAVDDAGVDDASVDCFLSVESIAEMRALHTNEMKNGQQVMVRGYHAGSDVGGGLFVWDRSCTAADNGGTVFAADDAEEGRWKRVNVRKIDWLDFGINQGTISGSEFQAPFDYGIANGFTDFELPRHDMTLTGPVRFTVPDEVTKPITIAGDGKLSFEYDWEDEERQSLFRIIGNKLIGGTVRLNLNGSGMGRYPDQLRVVTGLRLDDMPASTVRLHVEEMYGFGFRIHGSPGSHLYITAINCDGQKISHDNGAHDYYGDGIYIATTDVTVHSPVVTTVNGGRGGIVFESFNSRTSGRVLNPHIEGYDRGIHVEGGPTTSGNVLIEGGTIVNCNAAVWNFSSGGIVSCRGVAFEFDLQISHQVIANTTIGHVSTYGRDSRTTTEGCVFRANDHPVTARAIYCGGSHVSISDVFEAGSGHIDINNARFFSLSNFQGHDRAIMQSHNTDMVRISNGFWSGGIELPLTNDVCIEDVVMQAPENETFCGTIESVNKRGGKISRVTFENPETYCIENWRKKDIPGPLPIYEAITAIRQTTESSPKIIRYQPGQNGEHNYRSSLPSYIIDKATDPDNPTFVEIPPRTAD